VSDITLHIGDVFEQLAKIPDGSIDLIVTSPPFLALRSYLPDDHPDKDLEIGSESGPAAFLDTMMALSAEWGRVLAPHGSLCVELGDTYSGSGGAGGDYNADGLRDGQQRFSGSAAKRAALGSGDNERPSRSGRGDDWPMSKSKTMLDTLYPACLAYGANLLSGEVSPAGRWRIRNLIVWARPNPPVGALGDKFRPATSYITVACKSPRRWFDLDAVRSPYVNPTQVRGALHQFKDGANHDSNRGSLGEFRAEDGAGSPPLDWHADDHPEDGDWLWKMSPQGFAGSHYATFPMALPTRLIKAMCPERVCTVCGAPSERIVSVSTPRIAGQHGRAERQEGRRH
jgi:DNA modification methylase